MEEAAKSVKNLADQILPKQPYYLSLSPTRMYSIPPDPNVVEEKYIRPLQYLTLAGGEADRGVLITRAYFSVREEPNSSAKAHTPANLKIDPNKPRKKVSLKDYKNKKVEGDSPPKVDLKEKDKPNGLSTIKEKDEFKKPAEPVPKEMESRREAKKPTASVKAETTRLPSPSSERRKRVAEIDEGPKPVKRLKVEEGNLNGTAPRTLKSATPQKPTKSIPAIKTEAKDTRPSPVTNGRPASSNSALSAASPKHASRVNGHGKLNGGQATHKRAVSTGDPVSKAVPRLLSPLYMADLSADRASDKFKENALESRPSPRKRPAEASAAKIQAKKLRDDHEPPAIIKKNNVVPALLSPTLPPIVMEELAKLEKRAGTSPKDGSLKNGRVSDSSVIVKKPAKSNREETIYVESKKQEPPSFIVTMKYKKRHAKTIERLLNLPSGAKKKPEGPKREDRSVREGSGSVEPGTARKRPRTTADTTEALKRPKGNLRPATPPKQSIAMSRIASNSSQVGTPGAANSLTPSTQISSEKRREPVPPEKLQRAQRLHNGHKFFMELGTKLKHERDAIMKNKAGVHEREHQLAVAAGFQSLLLYMHAVKLQSDALDLERLPRRPQSWKEILPLFPVVRSDCSRSFPLSALLFRIQGICTHFMGRAFWFLPSEPDMSEKIISTAREEGDTWRMADHARRKLGSHDGTSSSSDGGTVGSLIDRLGPWTSPEDAIPITIEILRNVIRIDGSWKPVEELAKIGRSVGSGSS